MKYNVIYGDPAWSYNDKCHAGKRGAVYKYALMGDKAIMDLPVRNIMADDCFVFLWATWPKLPVAIQVLEAWGAPYRTVGFNWLKTNKKKPSWFWGMGSYTRSNSEICLLGIRGRPKVVSRGVHQVIGPEWSPATINLDDPIEGHSKKPDRTRDLIEQLAGDVPRVELWARQAAPGWDAVGNELGVTIEDFLAGKAEAVKGARGRIGIMQEAVREEPDPSVFFDAA